MRWYEKISFRTYLLLAITLIACAALILLLMGRTPLCECGYIKLWHGVVFSSENSQHLTDWYTPSHIIHGFGFYFLLWLIGRRLPIGLRLILAIILESSWEILENTDLIINRYRDATIALDYYGDSVINSVMDILSAVVGFFLAYRLPVWLTISLALLMEAWVGLAIRDNLTLNIIMLLHPLEAIKAWQAGA